MALKNIKSFLHGIDNFGFQEGTKFEGLNLYQAAQLSLLKSIQHRLGVLVFFLVVLPIFLGLFAACTGGLF